MVSNKKSLQRNLKITLVIMLLLEDEKVAAEVKNSSN